MGNWTEDQLAELNANRVVRPLFPTAAPAAKPSPQRAAFALGRLPTGTMNRTEADYDMHLWKLRHAGEILWYKFEGIKLRLADNTFLTVDFAVLPASGYLEMHEVKGHWQDDARVKMKVAASLYPFKFVALKVRAKKRGGGYDREEF